MSQVTIASIYPLTVGISRPRFIPTGQFWIEGVPANCSADVIRERVKNPVYKVIEDQYESNRAPVSHMEIKEKFSAEEVGLDFLKHATQGSPGMSAGCHPGVWMCADPGQGGEPGKATEAEITAGRQAQSLFFADRMEFANSLATDPRSAKAITWLMRVAAMGLGREPAWLNPPSDLDVTECPYCRKNVPVNAATCFGCGNVVNFELFAALEAKKKAAMKAIQAA